MAKTQLWGKSQVINTDTMERPLKPVEQYYYSKEEWARLGCGPLPPERDRNHQLQNTAARGNPTIDGKVVKGYN
jgi:hypothetical protein